MLSFHIEPDENEFHAWCSELPGCHTHGRTPKEAAKNLKEAIMLYLEVIMEETLQKKLQYA
ncbi:MAG: type II toxin-antitoxin system HicB family antitoxin [Candidatus Peregrinibacteria bacterium]